MSQRKTQINLIFEFPDVTWGGFSFMSFQLLSFSFSAENRGNILKFCNIFGTPFHHFEFPYVREHPHIT